MRRPDVKKYLALILTAVLAIGPIAIPLSAQVGQSDLSRVAGLFVANNYNFRASVMQGATASGVQTLIVSNPQGLPDGRQILPYSLTAPVTVDSETETPTSVAVATCPGGQIPQGCTAITATWTAIHGSGQNNVSSGTYGLQEAINDASGCQYASSTSILCGSQGGEVVIDKSWKGTNSLITAASPYNNVAIMDLRQGVPIFWNVTPTGASLAVPTTLTSQAACDATHQFCSDATVAGSASWGSTVFGCVAYVDIMGNEGPCSLTASFTSVASKAIDVKAPAASTGAVGYVVYLSLSGGTYAQAYQIPSTASNCTLTTLETTLPACAVTNATYGQTGSTFGQTALFTTGGSQITTYPVNTGLHFTQLASVAMTAASQTPVSNSSVSYTYAPGSHVGLPGISPANSSIYAAAGSSATLIPNAIATWTIPAGQFNYIGAEFRVTGKWTYTDGGDTSTNLYVKWDAPGTNATTVGTTLCNVLDTATGTGAAYNGTYTCTVKVVSIGATGTALVNGYSTQSLAAGATTLVRNGADIAVAASGSIDLASIARISVYFIGTGATNNPGAQGLEATLEQLN